MSGWEFYFRIICASDVWHVKMFLLSYPCGLGTWRWLRSVTHLIWRRTYFPIIKKFLYTFSVVCCILRSTLAYGNSEFEKIWKKRFIFVFTFRVFSDLSVIDNFGNFFTLRVVFSQWRRNSPKENSLGSHYN